MGYLYAAGAVFGIAIIALVIWSLRTPGRGLRHEASAKAVPPAGLGVVVIDVGEVFAESDEVRRVVQDAARRFFAESPGVATVEVRNRAGRPLGRISARARPVRPSESPPRIPRRVVHGHEPTPVVRHDELRPNVVPHFDARERPAPRRALADSFEMSDTIHDRIRDPDDAAELIRAIVEASGRTVTVEDGLLRTGDEIVIVVGEAEARASMHEALNHAYLRFRANNAARGLVVAAGYLEAGDVRRREMLVPELRHASIDAIQRMADAVALGADPLAFAAGPPVIATERPARGRRDRDRPPDRKAG